MTGKLVSHYTFLEKLSESERGVVYQAGDCKSKMEIESNDNWSPYSYINVFIMLNMSEEATMIWNRFEAEYPNDVNGK